MVSGRNGQRGPVFRIGRRQLAASRRTQPRQMVMNRSTGSRDTAVAVRRIRTGSHRVRGPLARPSRASHGTSAERLDRALLNVVLRLPHLGEFPGRPSAKVEVRIRVQQGAQRDWIGGGCGIAGTSVVDKDWFPNSVRLGRCPRADLRVYASGSSKLIHPRTQSRELLNFDRTSASPEVPIKVLRASRTRSRLDTGCACQLSVLAKRRPTIAAASSGSVRRTSNSVRS